MRTRIVSAVIIAVLPLFAAGSETTQQPVNFDAYINWGKSLEKISQCRFDPRQLPEASEMLSSASALQSLVMETQQLPGILNEYNRLQAVLGQSPAEKAQQDKVDAAMLRGLTKPGGLAAIAQLQRARGQALAVQQNSPERVAARRRIDQLSAQTTSIVQRVRGHEEQNRYFSAKHALALRLTSMLERSTDTEDLLHNVITTSNYVPIMENCPNLTGDDASNNFYHTLLISADRISPTVRRKLKAAAVAQRTSTGYSDAITSIITSRAFVDTPGLANDLSEARNHLASLRQTEETTRLAATRQAEVRAAAEAARTSAQDHARELVNGPGEQALGRMFAREYVEAHPAYSTNWGRSMLSYSENKSILNVLGSGQERTWDIKGVHCKPLPKRAYSCSYLLTINTKYNLLGFSPPIPSQTMRRTDVLTPIAGGGWQSDQVKASMNRLVDAEAQSGSSTSAYDPTKKNAIDKYFEAKEYGIIK